MDFLNHCPMPAIVQRASEEFRKPGVGFLTGWVRIQGRSPAAGSMLKIVKHGREVDLLGDQGIPYPEKERQL